MFAPVRSSEAWSFIHNCMVNARGKKCVLDKFKPFYKKIMTEKVDVSMCDKLGEKDSQGPVLGESETAAGLADVVRKVAWAVLALRSDEKPHLTVHSMKMDVLALLLLPSVFEVSRVITVDVPESESGKRELVEKAKAMADNFESHVKAVVITAPEPFVDRFSSLVLQIRGRLMKFKSSILEDKNEKMQKILVRMGELKSSEEMTKFMGTCSSDVLDLKKLTADEDELFRDKGTGEIFSAGYMQATRPLPLYYIFQTGHCFSVFLAYALRAKYDMHV